MPPAVKLAAAECARPAPDPGVLALEITEDLEAALAQLTLFASRSLALSGLPIYVAASQHAPFAEIAADLKT
jgi:hypothetical protein